MSHTYLIRGFTGPNADFSFKYTSDSMLNEQVIHRALLANIKSGTEWHAAVKAMDLYNLTREQERSDLRETDSQRVYLFQGDECHNDHTYTDENPEPEYEGADCEYTDFMVTIDAA